MPENMRTQSVCTKSIAANLIMVRVGCAFGWLSLSLPLLLSDETPLKTGPISTDEMSWLGCVAAPGAVLGNFLCGYIVTFIGTRNTLFLVGFPQLIGWLLLTFGTCPLHLVISRFVVGMANGGAQTCVFLFVSELNAELADNKIHGKLHKVFMHGRKIGVLIAFISGSYYNYVTASVYFIAITSVFLVALLFVPSTPQYYLQRNKVEKAEKAFNYYNKERVETDPKFCVVQFEHLKDVPKMETQKPESKLTWRDIRKSRYGLLQTIIFSLLNRLTAHSIFLTYGSVIITKMGSNFPPELASIIMSGVQLVSTFFTLKLIVSKGRKFLLILSLVGCAISHVIMIVYMQLNGHFIDKYGLFHLIPLICMSVAIFVASVGIVPLTFICTAESFSSKTRPFGMTFGNIVLNSLAFLLYKIFPSLEEKIGMQTCLIVFCVSCILGTIYVAVIVEENKIPDLNDEDDDTNETDEADGETDESDQDDETTSLRYDLRRLSRQFRQSHHRIQPYQLRKFSVVSFA